MVHIITDSSSDLSSSIIFELGITVIPANILFGREKYRDGIDINSREFYDKLANAYFQPVTTPASPLQFYEAFQKYEEIGEDILVITLPESLSGFRNSALTAAEHITDVNVYVMNSGGLSGFQGLICIQAAKLAKAGLSMELIIDTIERLKSRTSFYALVPTFGQLIRSGRVPGLAGRLGGLLGIFPLLSMRDEKLETIAKPKGFNKGYDMIIYELRSLYSRDEPLICNIMDALNPTWAAKLEELITYNFNVKEFIYSKVGPTIGANSGAGVVGLSIGPVLTNY